MYSPIGQSGHAAVDEMDDGDDAAEDEDDEGPSTCFLMAINSFAFAYSLVVCTLGVIVLPSEAVHLFREKHAMMLGVMLGCTGITQLISPAIGYLSDRSTSRHGRRRPLMVLGAIISCFGNLLMLSARELQLRYGFIAALTVAIAGMNTSYACFTALLPDLIPVAHIGRASGTMATMSMLGALTGFALFGFWLGTVHAYLVYCIAVSVTVLVTCFVAREKAHLEPKQHSCAELLSSYSIDVIAHPDFFWVFVTRTFYYMGISLQAFVLVGGSQPKSALAARCLPPVLQCSVLIATRGLCTCTAGALHAARRAAGGRPDLLHVAACHDRSARRRRGRDPVGTPLRPVRAQAARVDGVCVHGDRVPGLRVHAGPAYSPTARRRLRHRQRGLPLSGLCPRVRHAAGARVGLSAAGCARPRVTLRDTPASKLWTTPCAVQCARRARLLRSCLTV